MTALHTCWSTLVAWGMIPLAVWAGLPSTACVCADGRIKLVCAHPGCGGKAHAGHGTRADHEHGCCSSHCCGADASLAADRSHHEADCCGGERHGPDADQNGVHSKTCCKPVLAAPSMAPKAAGASYRPAPALVALCVEFGSPARTFVRQDAAALDTGPPLDRVIVFRSLLI